MAPSSPRRQFGAPEVFFPGAPQGRPCLCLNDALFVMLIHLFLSFFPFLSLFFPLFISLSFPFSSFFGAPLLTRGGEAPKAPAGYAPVLV